MTPCTFRDQVASLLTEAPSARCSDQRIRARELLRGSIKQVLIFGAGNLGKKVLQGLHRLRVPVLSFVDNSPGKQGDTIEGISIISTSTAARIYPAATIVIAIWRSPATETMQDRIASLELAGFSSILPFYYIFWEKPDVFLPHYSVGAPDSVRKDASLIVQAAFLLSEDQSRFEFLQQLRWRLDPEATCLDKCETTEPYFGPEIFTKRSDEIYIDCGGYNGDTLNAFIAANGSRFEKALVFEPDPLNYSELIKTVGKYADEISRRVSIYPYALGRTPEQRRFDSEAAHTSKFDSTGSLLVDCVNIDSIVDCENATFIKMDIEGAELDAILGCQNVITRSRPLIAVCLYHEQSHLWSIPLTIASYVSDYNYILRAHGKDGTDLVLYAIPRERALPEQC